MQSVKQHAGVNQHDPAAEAALPIRPEPLVADRLSTISETAFAANAGHGGSMTGARAELAAAFRRLGRGVEAGAAFRKAKYFYKSSGHHWARGLR